MQHFVDEAVITIQSGNGGAGCVSFRREKYIPFGGPDGGDGGEGGSVIFLVKQNLRTLYNLKLKKNFKAQNGQPGMGERRSGKKGNDSIVEVPPGTMIYDYESGKLIKDLKETGEEYVILDGGKGGKGNTFFKTSTNQAPKFAQPGLPGVEMKVKVELKLIADVGLVGFPNAGKSTLLSVVSKAKPKIANYPFTTLVPNLGVLNVADETLVMADIPGIIEGASNGAGLGIKFLKHIERTKIILFVINIEEENYLEQYDKLKFELKQYSKILAKKDYLISVSKIDIADSEQKVDELKKKIKKDIVPFSALTKKGLNDLLYRIKDKIYQVENGETKR